MWKLPVASLLLAALTPSNAAPLLRDERPLRTDVLRGEHEQAVALGACSYLRNKCDDAADSSRGSLLPGVEAWQAVAAHEVCLKCEAMCAAVAPLLTNEFPGLGIPNQAAANVNEIVCRGNKWQIRVDHINGDVAAEALLVRKGAAQECYAQLGACNQFGSANPAACKPCVESCGVLTVEEVILSKGLAKAGDAASDALSTAWNGVSHHFSGSFQSTERGGPVSRAWNFIQRAGRAFYRLFTKYGEATTYVYNPSATMYCALGALDGDASPLDSWAQSLSGLA